MPSLFFTPFSPTGNQPCLCLCFGFSHITMILPWRRIILHLSHIFLMEGFTFILITIPFCLGTPCNSSFGEIIYRDLYRNLITGQYPNIIHSQLSGNTRGHDMSVRQLNLKGCVWHCFDYSAFKFKNIILCQNNPSAFLFRIVVSVYLSNPHSSVKDREHLPQP